MRIRAITPIVVPDDELARRQDRYQALAPVGVEITVHNLSAGPDRLESESQIRDSEERVFSDAIATSGFDGVFLDCVLDPALEQLQEQMSVPVFGITKLVSGYLAATVPRFGGVARNQAIADELARRVADFGHGDQFSGVTVLDLSLEDIADTDRWNRVTQERLNPDAGVVINGCSAVEVQAGQGPVVVDPTAMALRLIGAGLPAHRGSQ